ncbi:methylated-DNA--[protein]-cysteine S-methyltransferase [Streptococcus pneumoniae]|nr:methylated-DNA--[protein]-cysteine S-methyltransferase [Streptococcus pneumoniae]
MYKTYYKSPIGRILIMTDGSALLGLWLEGQKYYGAGYDLEQAQQEETEVSQRVVAWLDAYFEGENPPTDEILLAPQVTEFRSKVLAVLQKITYLIPCHRIVGSDGELTGYAGGLDKKAFLLKLESGEKTRG